MKLRVLYFAGLRERVGLASEEIEVPADIRTCADVRAWLRERGGAWAEALAEGTNVRIALNQRIVRAETALEEGAELAFFPPVTGG
jgi:molybdopterin synthase sulfur carrier subunit